jgi:tetratricopeptide (TPR) repeat protein
MLNKININSKEQILIIYIVLAVVTLAVFWQVSQYDFIGLDDFEYIVNNSHIQSGITLDGVRWAFSTTNQNLWNPLIWLSLMFDYQLFGLNAGGYHMTNLILHILSTLLLFWLFKRMTNEIWKSAFIAAVFALHPLHVESVAWVSERKDVLSAFFWMLTLCFYEKPAIKRYLLVLFSFVCSLMSKSMVVTLPVIMILIDYWPLGRFQSKKGSLLLWQLWEKTPFFVLSAVLAIITFYAMYDPTIKDYFPLGSRFANAPVSFVTYLGKTFWPHDMTIFYPFVKQLPIWQVWGAVLLILLISVAVIAMMKRMPYLLIGWLWYAITLLPVMGIIQNGYYAMADRYTYLPSIGIAIMLAWGIPPLFPREDIRKKILIPAEMAVLSILAILAWQQCGYWKNSFHLFNHAVLVTKDNYLAHNSLGTALTYAGKYEEAIEHCNKAIRIKPDYANAYVGRAFIYYNTGQYEQALEDLNVAIRLQPDYVDIYLNMGITYNKLRQFHMAIENYNKAIQIQPERIDFYNGRGYAYANLNKYQIAIEDFNTAIRLKPDFAESYKYRGFAYLRQGNNELGCLDAHRACDLGDCELLELAKRKGICR